MILSHKHKFILVRPKKVAGSSILHNLGKWCGDDDIVTDTPEAILRSNVLKKTNIQTVCRNIFSDLGLKMHIKPSKIREMYPVEWKKYSRIGCIRNPYDIAYSMYCMLTREKYFVMETEKYNRSFISGRSFKDWIKKLIVNPDHEIAVSEFAESYWFYDDTNEEVKYDFMIRYENLEDDYKTVCNHFNIPHEPLVKLNTETRLDVDEDRSYQKHYDDESRDFIKKVWSKVIKRYDYEF